MGEKIKTGFVIEYIGAILLRFIFNILPLNLSLSFGALLGKVAYYILRGRRILTLNNLVMALPKKNENERIKIAKDVWKNLGRTAAEFAREYKMSGEEVMQKVKIVGRENLDIALSSKKGVIIFSAHFGNWELFATWLVMSGYKSRALARLQKNLLFEKLIIETRETAGVKVFYHHESIENITKFLKDNKVIFILMDQNLYRGGIFVNFFGIPAATSTIISLFALRTGCSVVPGFIVREEKKFHTIHLEPELKLERTGNLKEDIRRNTENYNIAIEKWIRRYPEQWLWAHNRWKRKPDIDN